MKTIKTLVTAAVVFACVVSFSATAKPVNITPNVASVEITVDGKKFTIERNQDNKNLIDSNYAKTSRPCPPFCIRPIVLAPGVETIGELELIEYLKQLDGDKNIMVIDSRTPDWVARGTIAGAVNIPWTGLDAKKGATELDIELIVVDEFGAEKEDGKWDFSNAKTLVLFCNGMWCGQSPRNIMSLLALGYPAEKLKWYRGGMQTWHVLGLSTVMPK
ncbi:MAG: sulfurtransferase [Piscirickettsiaceae bacterium]|nr:MAG: sulfurtransferase [Piscirickettsiaceae bacterium]PCI67283.1 MAG: sulfurtransferase [Piscirickettsiaceae bacterium]